MPSLQVVCGDLTKRRVGTSKTAADVSPVARSLHFSFNYSQLQRRSGPSARYRFDNCRYRENSREVRVTLARARTKLRRIIPRLREVTATTIIASRFHV